MSPQSEASFQDLKARLVSSPVLTYGNFRLPFILEVNASHDGLGSALSQEQEDSVRPITYASQSLHSAEKNPGNEVSHEVEVQGVPSGP